MTLLVILAFVAIAAATPWALEKLGLLERWFPSTPSTPEAPPQDSKKDKTLERTWHLNNLTKEEIREKAWKYQIKVSGSAGNTASRICFWLGCEFFVLWALWQMKNLFTSAMLAIVGFDTSLLLDLFVLGAWVCIFLLTTWAFFLVVVPKLSGLIVTSWLSGYLHTFGTGFGIRFPWETVDYKQNLISLRIKTAAKESAFVVEGIPFTYTWTAQWRPFLPLLPLNISFEEDAVIKAITDIIEDTISEETLGCKEDMILNAETTKKIESELLDSLEGAPGKEKYRDSFNNTIEERVGANIEISTLGPPKLNTDYQQAKIVAKTAKTMTDQALDMKEKLGLEGSEAMNNIMILNRETDVKKNIVEFEISKRLGDLGEHIGPIVAAADRIASRIPTKKEE